MTEATSNVGVVGACADTTLPRRQKTEKTQKYQRARDLNITLPSLSARVALSEVVEFLLKLCDPRELRLKLPLDFVDDLAAFVQRTDHRGEFGARHIQRPGLPYTADSPDVLYRGAPLAGMVLVDFRRRLILLLS